MWPRAGTWLPSWRRRWFVLKGGKLFWFKDHIVTQVTIGSSAVLVCVCMKAKLLLERRIASTRRVRAAHKLVAHWAHCTLVGGGGASTSMRQLGFAACRIHSLAV
jgi:hypothetical protein